MISWYCHLGTLDISWYFPFTLPLNSSKGKLRLSDLESLEWEGFQKDTEIKTHWAKIAASFGKSREARHTKKRYYCFLSPWCHVMLWFLCHETLMGSLCPACPLHPHTVLEEQAQRRRQPRGCIFTGATLHAAVACWSLLQNLPLSWQLGYSLMVQGEKTCFCWKLCFRGRSKLCFSICRLFRYQNSFFTRQKYIIVGASSLCVGSRW